jgi:hypothetical protein
MRPVRDIVTPYSTVEDNVSSVKGISQKLRIASHLGREALNETASIVETIAEAAMQSVRSPLPELNEPWA